MTPEDMTPEEKYEALKTLYDTLPKLEDCKGLCASGCTDIDMSNFERERIEHRQQVKIKTRSWQDIQAKGPKRCKALDKSNRCRIYEDRPLICRAWGVIEAAPCPFGCTPKDGRYLTDLEYKRLELAVESLGGHWWRTEADRVAVWRSLQTAKGRAELKRQMDKARAEIARMREQVTVNAGTSGANV